MASETAKKFARYIYKILCALQWGLCIVMAVLTALAIYFARGTSGYYGGALAVFAILLIVSLQSSIILKGLKKHDKNAYTKKSFADTFNCHGVFILLSMGASIAGIATGAAIGAQYGKNHNETDTSQDDDYINKDENRIIGTLIAVLSGITLVIMIRIVCLHGEIRGLLSIPEKPAAPAPASSAPTAPASTTSGPSTPAPTAPAPTAPVPTTPAPTTSARTAPAPTAAAKPAPTPKPADQLQPGTSTSGDPKDRPFAREIEILTTQNNLLKEHNRLQKEQLEQMAALNANLRQFSFARLPEPIPPPPDYLSLGIVSPPRYAFPDTSGPPAGDKK